MLKAKDGEFAIIKNQLGPFSGFNPLEIEGFGFIEKCKKTL